MNEQEPTTDVMRKLAVRESLKETAARVIAEGFMGVRPEGRDKFAILTYALSRADGSMSLAAFAEETTIPHNKLEQLLNSPNSWFSCISTGKIARSELGESEYQRLLNDGFEFSPPSCCGGDRHKTEIVIRDFEYQTGTQRLNGSVAFQVQFNVYSFTIGRGRQVFYLLTNPTKNLPLGAGDYYLTPGEGGEILRPEKKFLLKICKEHEIKTKNELGDLAEQELWLEILERHKKDPIFFRLALPLSNQEVDALKLKSPEELEANFGRFIGIQLDPALFYLFRGLSLPNSPAMLPDMAKYNPHAVIVTNPSTGKTTNASKLGRVYNRASPSCLLGFSTADSTTQGALNGACEPVFFDDMQDEKSEATKNGLLSFEEQGRADNALGKATVRTRGTASLIYFANTNPRRKNADCGLSNFLETTPADLCFSLESQLSKATNNPRASGRRKAILLFGNDFKPARGTPDQTQGDMPEKVEECLRELAAPELLRIFQNREILTWLEQPFSAEYTQQITTLAAKVVSGSLAEFFIGFAEAHRHARGLALRHAIRDNLPAVLNGTWTAEALIESAEQHLQTLQNYNLQSIMRVVEVEPKVTAEFYVQQVKNFRPEYGRHLLYTLVYIAGKFRDEELKEALPLEIIAANHGLAQEAAGCPGAYFSTWSRLAGKLNASALRSALQGVGVDIWRVGDATLLKLLEVERLRRVGSSLFQKKGTPQQKEGENGVTGVNLPQITQLPQGYEGGQAEKPPVPSAETPKNPSAQPSEPSAGVKPPRMRGQIHEYLKGKGLTHSLDIAKALGVQDSHLSLFESMLSDMVRAGELNKDQQGRYYV